MADDKERAPLVSPKPTSFNQFRGAQWTPIEVLVTLYFMAMISIFTIQQYFVIAVIAEQHNQSNFINHGASNCNHSKSENNAIEEESSQFLMYLGFCSTFLSVIPILVLGSIADRIGRKPVMCFCLCGLLIKEIVYIVVIHFHLSLYFLYIGVIAEGLTGSFGGIMMALFGMTADITTPGKNRALRISVVEGTAAITVAFSLLGIGYWIKYEGFYMPMVFTCVVTILAIIFCVVFIPETSHFQSQNGQFCSASYLLKCFRLYYQKEPSGRRKKLIVALFILALTGASVLGRSSTQTLFLLNHPLCWTEVHVQIFNSVQTLMNWGTVIVVVRILHMFTQDYGILIIGSLSGAASLCIFSFATKDWIVYLFVVVGIFGSSVFPMLRAMMSRQCTPDEQGSLFATISSTELLFTAFSQLAYGGIYKLSVSFYPGLVFLIMSCILFFVLILSIILYRWMVTDTAPTWEVIN